MKTLVLTACVGWLTACGGSSSNPSDTQNQPSPLVAVQTPQPPAESIPPANAQTPAFDQQTPTASQDQVPPLDAQQPSLSADAACMAVVAAVQSRGCLVSDLQMAQCINYATAGLTTACTVELGNLLACVLHEVSCGQASVSSADIEQFCPTELKNFTSCLTTEMAATDCSPSTSCVGCNSTCSECNCEAQSYPSQGIDCSTYCNATN